MSDYESPCAGPLFELTASPSVAVETRSAKKYHERKAQQAAVLAELRRGVRLTRIDYESANPGSRLAPAVDKLRNSHGFDVVGNGTSQDPYWMVNVAQVPSLVSSTPDMQAAYYETRHWVEMRSKRFAFDGHKCVCCGAGKLLECHHVIYKLFDEQLPHLLTVCRPHHELIHESSRIGFPAGIRTEHVSRLGFEVSFEGWLLP